MKHLIFLANLVNFPAGFASTSFEGFSPAVVAANLQQFKQ